MDSHNNNRDTTKGVRRYTSRLKREMQANRINPFNSPPSSTGTGHGTVTITDSSIDITQNNASQNITSQGIASQNRAPHNKGRKGYTPRKKANIRDYYEFDISGFSYEPDAVSTPQLFDKHSFEVLRGPPADRDDDGNNVNTSALAREFPEWHNVTSNTDTDALNINFNNSKFKDNFAPNPPKPSRKIAQTTGIIASKSAGGPAAPPAPIAINEDAKENIPPSPTKDIIPIEDLAGYRRKLTRAEMQPRVETASNTSTIIRSPSPKKPLTASRPSRFAKAKSQSQPNQEAQQAQPAKPAEQTQPTEQAEPPLTPLQAGIAGLRNKIAAGRAWQAAQAGQQSATFDKPAPTSAINGAVSPRTFLLPCFHHIPDWTSGTLQFSALRNGVPVFVKHGKARTQLKTPAHDYDTMEAVDLAEDDHEIFVSMDKIRDEVRELQEHDEMVQREAEKLQDEVSRLQSELKRLRQRKGSDSAIGSGSESDQSMNRALDAQRNMYDEKIAHLQSRLDEASRQVGVNDIHSAALTAERDEALHQASVAREQAKELEAQLNTHKEAATRSATKLADAYKMRRAELDAVRRELEGTRIELESVSKDLEDLRSRYSKLQIKNQGLFQNNKELQHHTSEYLDLNRTLKAEKLEQKKHIVDLQDTLVRQGQLIEELQRNIAEGSRHEACQQQLKEYEELVKGFKQQYSESMGQSDALAESKDDKIRTLKAEVDDLAQSRNDKIRERENIIGQQDRKIQALAKELQSKDDEMKSMMMDELEALESAQHKNTELEYEVQALKRQISSLKDQELQFKHDEMKTVKRQVSSVKGKELQSKDNEIKALKRELSALKAKVLQSHDDEIRSMLLDDFENFVAVQRRNTELEHEVQTLKRQMSTLDKVQHKNARLSHSANVLSDELRQKKASWGQEKSDFHKRIERQQLTIKNLSRAAELTSNASVRSGSVSSGIVATSKPAEIENIVSKALQDDEEIDFLSLMSNEFPDLDPKQRQSGSRRHNKHDVEVASAANTSQATESPASSGTIIRRRAISDPIAQRIQRQDKPAGILKPSSPDDDTTGRFSDRSASSAGSRRSSQSKKSVEFYENVQTLEFDRAVATLDHEENMTSAFIVPDITIEDKKPTSSAKQQTTVPALSKEAKTVLDGLCTHKLSNSNCDVCSRLTTKPKHTSQYTSQHSYRDYVGDFRARLQARNLVLPAQAAVQEQTHTTKYLRRRVQRPIPVSERVRPPTAQGQPDEDLTIRPSNPPGLSLAMVIDDTKKEIELWEGTLAARTALYSGTDKTSGWRARKRCAEKLQEAKDRIEALSDRLYRLYDVLEGQRAAGQEMTQDEVDVTVSNIMAEMERRPLPRP